MKAQGKDNGIVEAIRKSGAAKVKVAVSDIDGILRGKFLLFVKFLSARDTRFRFCDVLLA